MTQEQKKMVFGCALGESITHPTWGSYPLLEEAIRKCDGQLSDIYVTDELISEFNAYVLKKAVATPPPQGLAWVNIVNGDLSTLPRDGEEYLFDSDGYHT